MRTDELVIFRDLKYRDLAKKLEKADDMPADADRNELKKLVSGIAADIIGIAEMYGFSENLWQKTVALMLADNENVYSKALEINGNAGGSLDRIVLKDMSVLRELFFYDLNRLDEKAGTGIMSLITDYSGNPGKDPEKGSVDKRTQRMISDLSDRLAAAKDEQGFMDELADFYKSFGVGKFGLNRAFRVLHDKDDRVCIVPIPNPMPVELDDLVGYEAAKQKLIDNTEAFVLGKRANNCLLFGPSGTGKSSSVKGLLNRYYDRGLRIIELYKHQFKDLNEITAQIKGRNYRFIIYMDDLSFEDHETEYKYLKAVIEGGIEKRPDNVLIYATSNRRHLIREAFSDRNDRDDELHISDTMQEKLSLSTRFGVTVYFGSPDKKEFNNIVRELAKRSGIKMPEEELLAEANKWELSHGGLSGRTAQNFIDYLAGRG
ncbi:MAG: ATP-binding protein [Lachnospiraceae bacterium]|nr:ATP-binding protein [Lachnospiraceae bacterium]